MYSRVKRLLDFILALGGIVVLSPRPAVIQASFAVPQPHPRKLSSPDLQALKDAILAELGL